MDEIRIGSYTLKPRRQLACGGQPVPLGKRALDILSTLAEADGEILTKDELLASVWPGAIVEENALQVHMVALRRALGNDAERLKTIRGVGYQLQIGNGHAQPLSLARSDGIAPERADGRDQGAAFVRRWTLAALAAAVLGAAIVAASWRSNASQGQEIVRVEPIAGTGGDAARLLSVTLHDNIVQVFNQTNVQIASPRRAGWFGGSNATQVLRGTVAQSAGRLHVDLFLDDAASGTTLWSRQFERDLGASDTLSTEASAAAARTIHSIRQSSVQHGLRLDPETLALELRDEDMVRNAQLLDEGAPRTLSEQIIARQPNWAMGHGMLAMALQVEYRRGGRQASRTLLDKAQREAQTAIALDPYAAGPAYDALYNVARLEHPRQIAQAQQWLAKGVAEAPTFAFLWMRYCRMLTDVGRAMDALPYCQRGLALHPFAEPIEHTYATTLSVLGRDEEAHDAIAQAALYNPDHRMTRLVRFDLAAFGSRPAEALALLRDPATAPTQFRSREIAVLTRYLKDASKWTPQERRELAGDVTELAAHGEMSVGEAVMALTALGHLDEAFTLLHSPGLDEALYMTAADFLFQPITAPLRADPRFWTVAANLGMVRYWNESGKWPDMCGDEVPLPVCKAQAAQAVRSAG